MIGWYTKKEALIEETGNRIKLILKEIHQAAFEDKDFEGMGARVAVHSVLLKEKEAIENLTQR
jgi:hypothetical protein